MSAMNFCPPNPGSTVITRTISTSSTNGKTASTGVLGLIPIPTFTKKNKTKKHRKCSAVTYLQHYIAYFGSIRQSTTCH